MVGWWFSKTAESNRTGKKRPEGFGSRAHLGGRRACYRPSGTRAEKGQGNREGSRLRKRGEESVSGSTKPLGAAEWLFHCSQEVGPLEF